MNIYNLMYVVVGIICLTLGVRVYHSPDQNKIFTKLNLRLKNPTKYNHVCGILIVAFGIAAAATMFFGSFLTGVASALCTLGVVLEAALTVSLYRYFEKKFIQE